MLGHAVMAGNSPPSRTSLLNRYRFYQRTSPRRPDTTAQAPASTAPPPSVGRLDSPSPVGAAPSQLASMDESKGSSLIPSVPTSRSHAARSSVSASAVLPQKGNGSAPGISR